MSFPEHIEWLIGALTAFVAGCAAVLKSLKGLQTKVDEVAYETQPNGGESMRDAIDEIGKRIAHLEARSAASMRAMLDTTSEPWWESDAEGECLFINRAMERLTGMGRSEARDHGWVSFLHVDDRDAVRDEWYSAAREGRMFDMRYRYVNLATGDVHHVHAVAQHYTVDGVRLGYYGRAVVESTDER